MVRTSEILSGSGQKNEMRETHSCSCGGRYQNHQKREPYSKTVFHCSKKCEGDKTYDVPANCPVCNMQLEQIAEVQQRYYL